MKDSHGRTIDYIRISITDRCNLRCRYCMPEDIPSISHEEILRFEDILRICRLAGRASASSRSQAASLWCAGAVCLF